MPQRRYGGRTPLAFMLHAASAWRRGAGAVLHVLRLEPPGDIPRPPRQYSSTPSRLVEHRPRPPREGHQRPRGRHRPQAKAIIPVARSTACHTGSTRITEIADSHGIPSDRGRRQRPRKHLSTDESSAPSGAYGVLSFNGNKMITTSGGGSPRMPRRRGQEPRPLLRNAGTRVLPYYQHEHIGYNYRMSNICAGIGRGQMTVLDDHIAHHRHVQQQYYCRLLAGIPGITLHDNPSPRRLPAPTSGSAP